MRIEKFNTKHNLEKVLEIDIEAVKDFYELIKEKYNQNELRDIAKIHAENKGEYFLGFVDNDIEAICGYKIKNDSTVELRRFRVSKKYQNKGYGSQLLTYIEQRIKSEGFTKIVLETAALRNSTIFFYKKRNYKNIEENLYGKIKTLKFEKDLKIENV